MKLRALLIGSILVALYAGCAAQGREALDDTGAPGDASADARRRDSAVDGAPLPEEEGGTENDAGADAAPPTDGAPSEGGGPSDGSPSDGGGSDVANDAPPAGPIVDGTIAAGEYGSHVDGQNQETVQGTTWLMTWTATDLHVAVVNANLGEAAVLYIAPGAVRGDAGSAASGASAGYVYDSTKLDPLPVRATYVVYAKGTYKETRLWDGVSTWGAPTVNALTYAGSGNTRELSIPWSALGGRPASFAWVGYVTTQPGFVYGEMPPANPSGAVGQSAVFPYAYHVTDSTPGTGTKPFSLVIP